MKRLACALSVASALRAAQALRVVNRRALAPRSVCVPAAIERETRSVATSVATRSVATRSVANVRRSLAAAALGAAVVVHPCAACAKGGGYGPDSAPAPSSSSSYSSSYSSTYAPPPRRTVYRDRVVYVGERPPAGPLDAIVPAVALGAVAYAVSQQEDDPAAARRKKGGGLAVYAQELADVKALLRTLEAEAGDDAFRRPISGQYVGASDEDDRGDQTVVTNLRFDADGRLSGDGTDEVDGAYALSGRWAGGRCAWIEKYDDGFEVACTGSFEPDGAIFVLFCSSRGISGSVDLKLRTMA